MQPTQPINFKMSSFFIWSPMYFQIHSFSTENSWVTAYKVDTLYKTLPKKKMRHYARTHSVDCESMKKKDKKMTIINSDPCFKQCSETT
jgi:hypothetical protein